MLVDNSSVVIRIEFVSGVRGVLAYIRGEIKKKKTREYEFHAISTNFGTKLSLRIFNNLKKKWATDWSHYPQERGETKMTTSYEIEGAKQIQKSCHIFCV